MEKMMVSDFQSEFNQQTETWYIYCTKDEYANTTRKGLLMSSLHLCQRTKMILFAL